MQFEAKTALAMAAVGVALGYVGYTQDAWTLERVGLMAGLAGLTAMQTTYALSDTWKEYKAERQMNQTVDALETTVSNAQHTDKVALTSFVNIAQQSSSFFEHSSSKKQAHLTERLQAIGTSIASKMPDVAQTESAANVVRSTMAETQFKMGANFNQTPVSPTANIDVSIANSSSPSMG